MLINFVQKKKLTWHLFGGLWNPGFTDGPECRVLAGQEVWELQEDPIVISTTGETRDSRTGQSLDL